MIIGYTEEDFPTLHRRLVQAGMHPLRAARMLHNLTREDLAEVVGLGASTIKRAERGGVMIRPVTRQLLCAYFQLPPTAAWTVVEGLLVQIAKVTWQ